MRSAVRIIPPVTLAVVLGCLGLIGWVARSTRAQDTPEKPGPATSTVAAPEPSPQPKPGPATSTVAVPEPSPQPGLPPGSDLPPPGPAPAPVVVRTPCAVEPGIASPGAAETDDPEKNAQAFIDQNRKVAEAQLKSLKEEAEKLRSRLQKVDAGIQRWESLLAALPGREKVALDEAKKVRIRELMDQALAAYAAGQYAESEAYAKKAMEVDPSEVAASMLAFKARMERRFQSDRNPPERTSELEAIPKGRPQFSPKPAPPRTSDPEPGPAPGPDKPGSAPVQPPPIEPGPR
jgi:hypothetical protein